MAERSEPRDAQLAALLQKWADGRATLKDVRGYSDEELYSIARTAYFFYHQGRLNEARTLFQGLYAVNPADPYFARALGVVELAAGNGQGALAAYDVAIKLAPDDAQGYVGRAEVKLTLGQRPAAVEDLRTLKSLLERGRSLVVFPEGTFDRRPGLRAFHMGAFLLAAQSGVPVVPVAIRGTRAVLRSESHFARHGRVTIAITAPLQADGDDWSAALRLRDLTRSALLEECGEPDLAYEPTEVDRLASEARRTGV